MKKRNWTRALAKVRDEGRCRFCGRSDVPLECAHTLGREHDRFVGQTATVDPNDIAPLCASQGSRLGCHTLYDQHQISIFPHLRLPELERAIALAGEHQARHRLQGRPRAGDPPKPAARHLLERRIGP